MDEELKLNLIYATLQTGVNLPFNIVAGEVNRIFKLDSRQIIKKRKVYTTAGERAY